MLSFATPAWLVALALAPAIRWLHRGGRHRRELAVSQLALWRHEATPDAAAHARTPPDPAWRRRAAIAALLVLALAEPMREQPARALTLWIDDSPSMLTAEAGGSRLAVALARAASESKAAGLREVEVRRLGEPWRNLGAPGDTLIAQVGAVAGQRATAPPPAALLARERAHWLLTDGVHAAAMAWPPGLPPERVIRVGGAAGNVGLERLAARRQPGDAGRIELLAKVVNGGDRAETRELVFGAGAFATAPQALRLEPGASAIVTATIVPAAALPVVATLRPADALPLDDGLVLDLAPLRRRRVVVDPACGQAIAAAVRSHPALIEHPQERADAELRIDCGIDGGALRVPTLRLQVAAALEPISGEPRWSARGPTPPRLGGEPPRLRAAAALDLRAGDQAWLSLDAHPVVASRAGPIPLLESSLDFAAAEAAQPGLTPLLLNAMLERLLGTPLLDATALVERAADSSRVVPAPATAASAAAEQAAGEGDRPTRASPLAVWPLSAAVPLLLWEAGALVAQWRRLRTRAGWPGRRAGRAPGPGTGGGDR